MSKIIAIIGHPNAGKTTLIRHITGAGQRDKIVYLQGTSGKILSVYIYRTMAVQEGQSRVTPPEMLLHLKGLILNVDIIVIPMRIEGHLNTPGFEEYLFALRDDGYTINDNVILRNDNNLPSNITSDFPIKYFDRDPSNVVAKNVSEFVGLA